MNDAAADSARWKAPAENGQILIWPEPPRLLEQTLANHRRLATADHVAIQGIALPRVRQAMRQWLGHHSAEQPIIATGHQVELAHPGVWAKNILINELARRLSGAPCLFAVDTDAPKHLHLRWPGQSLPITDDPRMATAGWLGLLDPPTPQHLQKMQTELSGAAARWSFAPAANDFLSAMRRGILDGTNLAHVLVNAIHHLEWDLGLRHEAMLASPIFSSPAYLLLVHHLLARAQAFASAYNAALAEYRVDNNIRNPGRPWPDLRISPDQVEVAIWIDDLETGERYRGTVVKTPLAMALRSARSGDEFLFDPAAEGWDAARRLGHFLNQNRLRLSPRALTLTAFLRLLVADQFVHGIGGARYDQVTDHLIANWFGLEPPAFCVTTATLFFPGADAKQRVDLQALRREGRRLRHGAGSPLKAQFLQRINALSRNSLQRRQAFQEMHDALAAEAAGDRYRQWQQRYDLGKQQAAHSLDLFDREMFFAIQPAERLTELIRTFQAELR